jgi:hypothetical protein
MTSNLPGSSAVLGSRSPLMSDFRPSNDVEPLGVNDAIYGVTQSILTGYLAIWR